MSELRVFGIRHHGPGSAASIVAALNDFGPDCVLLECPADAQDALVHVQDERLKPPVALLVFNPKQHRQASFFPFADFSPEWETIRYCQRNGVHLRAFDLPLGIRFSMTDEEAEERTQVHASAEQQKDPELAVDPLSHIGRIAGYSDGERWWEVELEQRVGTSDVFTAVNELMTSLRTELDRPETAETLLREAYMREQLRATLKQGYPKIAIVCGAWHAPVMDEKLFKKEDKARLKGLKKVNTQSTWIPWTYERLSFSSGYGAGVLSPAWYELLYTAPRAEVVTHWMVRAARLLREKDLDASSAHAIEAVHLASMLANIRGQALPGIEELQEAATTIFGGGHRERISIIHRKLVIGDSMGEVPEALATTPLQQDLIAEQKRTKLKPTAEDKPLELDLRTELHLEKSHLLHRLRLLDIPWGDPQHVSGKSGTFHEHWRLSWQPEFALAVVEAGLWGNTVIEAAARRTEDRARLINSIEQLSDLIEAALKADLALVMPALVQRLETLSASTKDITHLMGALPPLVGVLRYGNVRRTDTQQVAQVVHKLIPRIGISLPATCIGLDHDAATELLKRIKAVDQAVRLLQEEEHTTTWTQALYEIGRSSKANGLLSGAAVRSLFDTNGLDADETAKLFGLALSPANPTEHTTAWIEGFLGESGLLLIHDPRLFALIDEWVMTLSEEVFIETAPLLRRTFTNFTVPERVQLLRMVGGQKAPMEEVLDDIDMERAQRVLPTLRSLLGFNSTPAE
jgi:flagellar biosynthesis/type III secretory pathway chaperone